jgi:hypothetical protein
LKIKPESFMGEDRERLERLAEKVEELLIVLNIIAEDLKAVAVSLRAIATAQVGQPVKALSIEDVKKMFPEDLEGLLNFEDKGEYIKITPRQYLGAENFAKIAQIVRDAGGDYVSAGKDSHFRVPKIRA